MRKSTASMVCVVSVLAALVATVAVAAEWSSGKPWSEPPIVDPGPVGGPPSDAIVLFDGKDLATHWHGADKWIVEDGVAMPAGGGITSKQGFGSCQLHLEFRTPTDDFDHGQGRGNSGVYLMNRYEVQILDSYENTTYFDGQCGSIYKQSPPLVNVCRKPGEWQTYDIIFTAPEFNDEGNVVKPAYVTVLHNGVLVQNHFEIEGTTAWDSPPAYEKHGDKAPLHIQYHGDKVEFRNIWIRPLEKRALDK